MKKQIDFQLIAIFGSGLLFNYLFWMEQLAINLLIYSIFMTILLWAAQQFTKSKQTTLVAASHLIAAVLVSYNHSILTLIGYYVSFALLVGLVHAPQLRTVFTALAVTLLQLLAAPISFAKTLAKVKVVNFSVQPLLKPFKYIIIPIFMLLLFTFTYSNANPVFASYTENILNYIALFLANSFNFFFAALNIARLLQLFLGILLGTGILVGLKNNLLEKTEMSLNDQLNRQRKNLKNPSFTHEVLDVFAGSLIRKSMALKTENIVGILSFTILNLLLFFLNLIDISTLWFGNIISKNPSSALHDGTNALILSIVMAMLVILYFFRGNLNFFSKNKFIKGLAFVWIIQNTFLIFSVLLRDYQYIVSYGLTYKRIGVLVFLLLCTVGLITVYIKVAQQKTCFYLYKVNGWAWYILLLSFGLINWDVYIVDYNIANRKTIRLDLAHLLAMSDKTLPQLDQHRNMLALYLSKSEEPDNYEINQTEVDQTGNTTDTTVNVIDTSKREQETTAKRINLFNQNLDYRIKLFKLKWEHTSWLSWNYRDWQTHQYLNRKDPVTQP